VAEEEMPEEEFDFEEWISQGIRAMKRMKRERQHKLFHVGYRKHMRAASKEALLAFRSLLDEAIEQFEREPAPGRKGKSEAENG
jgi:hypothetical protein